MAERFRLGEPPIPRVLLKGIMAMSIASVGCSALSPSPTSTNTPDSTPSALVFDFDDKACSEESSRLCKVIAPQDPTTDILVSEQRKAAENLLNEWVRKNFLDKYGYSFKSLSTTHFYTKRGKAVSASEDPLGGEKILISTALIGPLHNMELPIAHHNTA